MMVYKGKDTKKKANILSLYYLFLPDGADKLPVSTISSGSMVAQHRTRLYMTVWHIISMVFALYK